VGTIWSLIHGDDRKFDEEDKRLMEGLGKVASLAYQTLGSIDDLKLEITERQKAETALCELNATLARRVDAETRERMHIWNVSQDLLVIAGLDGKYLSVNPAWTAILGWSETDLLDKSSQWLLHPDDQEKTRAELDRLARGQKTLRFESRLRAKDGSYRWVSWKATPDGGRIYATGRDITELKRAEEEHERLRQLEADLAHLNRLSMMGELAASLAHEVKQPIAATRNNASAALHFLDKNPPNLDKARLALGLIAEDSDRAGDIVDRIRDHTKKAPPRRNRFDLNEAVKEVLALAHSVIEKNGVSVRSRLAEWLPPVHGDRVQVQQVILNLILNAAEAMASVDARSRELSISTEKSQINGVLVAVGDTGPGIDPERVDRIFDAFYTTKSTGMGMGLSICRSIIHAHEGRLWADANEPRGAVFQFTLPSTEAELTNAAQPASMTGEPHQCT